MSRLQALRDKGILSSESCEKLGLFARLIQDWNAHVNLTGLESIQEIEEILIGESVAALAALGLPPGTRVLDYGSGAGIPGLVWAVSSMELSVTSMEIRHKKTTFQKEVVRTLNLANVKVLTGLFPRDTPDERFGCIVTRGVRFQPRLWEEGAEFLETEGILVQFVSPGASVPEEWRVIKVTAVTNLAIRRNPDVPRETTQKT